MFDIRKTDLQKLNSATKYPSIFTYHRMDRGKLQDDVQVPFADGETVYITEKIDGTNTRLIFGPDQSVLIGSREDLLWAYDDLIGNPSMGIVDAIKEVAVRLREEVRVQANKLVVAYFETYGYKIGDGAKNYTKTSEVSFRLFDVAIIDDYDELVEKSPSEIAAWRDNGGQRYVPEVMLHRTFANLFALPVAPRLQQFATPLPTGLDETYEFLTQFRETSCALTDDAEKKSEGVVIRNADRTKIAKLRFEDYERVLRRSK